MESENIRWEQRFTNYKKALAKLAEGAGKRQLSDLTDLEKEGLIQRFEYTYELAWKTLQDLLRSKGYTDIAGPNPVLAQAFQDGYITDNNVWRKMKKSREMTSHTYNSQTADEIASEIISQYYQVFLDLATTLAAEESNQNQNDFF